jgi:hypothetical protein
MLVHTCRCIFSFVLIGFYYKRKGFQKLFENGFEILEKKKKKWKISFSSPLWLLAAQLKSLARSASPPGSLASRSLLSLGPSLAH